MNKKMQDGARLGGRFQVECYRPDGSLAWTEDVHNVVTDEGLAHLLDAVLHGSTQITAWYCTLVESNTTPVANLTYATPSYTECTAYDEETRPAYTEAAATGDPPTTTNSANKAVFTISDSKTLYGASIVGGGTSATTKGDTAGGGTLLCYAKFGASQAVQDNYVVNLTYSLSADDDEV